MEKLTQKFLQYFTVFLYPLYIWSIHTYEAVVTWKAAFFEHSAAAVCKCNCAPTHRSVEMQSSGSLRRGEATCLCTIAHPVTTENAAGCFQIHSTEGVPLLQGKASTRWDICYKATSENFLKARNRSFTYRLHHRWLAAISLPMKRVTWLGQASPAIHRTQKCRLVHTQAHCSASFQYSLFYGALKKSSWCNKMSLSLKGGREDYCKAKEY